MLFPFAKINCFEDFSEFPDLKLLNSLCSEIKLSNEASDVLIVGTQHLNETTGSLISSLIRSGFLPENILLLGKNYSTNPLSVKKLRKLGCQIFIPEMDLKFGEFSEVVKKNILHVWEFAKKRLRENKFSGIVVLDDGGRFIETVPDDILLKYSVIGVEQTTKGIRREIVQKSSFPVISVATSRLKVNYESNIIAQGIIKSIQRIDLNGKCIGIIGLGNIGSAIWSFFKKNNKEIYAFDVLNDRKKESDSIENVIINSDIVFGCTGTVLDFDLSCLYGKKTILASCSSEDVEFKKLSEINLTPVKIPNKFCSPDLFYKFHFGETRLLNSGYPVNFRNDMELEDQNEIQLTRGLLFLGIFQGLQSIKVKKIPSGINQLSSDLENRLEELFYQSK